MGKDRFLGKAGTIALFAVIACGAIMGVALADGWNPAPGSNTATGANGEGLNRSSIVNTRHNLTMRYTTNRNLMSSYRNNYFEVCVYCHTPHGANSTVGAPIWNRTILQREYSLYSNPASLEDLNKSQPGPNSLTCLSCHDGATAIDSVINMPTQLGGAFRAGYDSGQQSSVNTTFLNAWGDATNPNQLVEDGTLSAQGTATNIAPGGLVGTGHSALNAAGDGAGACMTCHNFSTGNRNSSFDPVFGGTGTAPDFSVFVIGGNFNRTSEIKDTDTTRVNNRLSNNQSVLTVGGGITSVTGNSFLADDHPIGVRYPTEFGADSGYNEPDVVKGRIAFFDRDNDGHADPEDIRLYDTGEGYEVECASCHDPHGVPVGDAEDSFIPSFLRVGLSTSTDTSTPRYTSEDESIRSAMASAGIVSSGNAGSRLCLTCHVK